MAISHQKKTVIKVDFEAGLLTKSDIANKHKLTRSTIYKIAAQEGWVYGKNRTEIDKATENRSLDNIINKQVDLATQITSSFLEDIEKYRKLSMMPASELATAYNEASKVDPVKKKKTKVTKEEFARIWESAKAIKTAIEALKLGYDGARKALGMDRDEKAKESMVDITLPEELDTPQNIKQASASILKDVSDGKITTGEGSAMINLLDSHRKTLETVDLEKRIEELEDRAE